MLACFMIIPLYHHISITLSSHLAVGLKLFDCQVIYIHLQADQASIVNRHFDGKPINRIKSKLRKKERKKKKKRKT